MKLRKPQLLQIPATRHSSFNTVPAIIWIHRLLCASLGAAAFLVSWAGPNLPEAGAAEGLQRPSQPQLLPRLEAGTLVAEGEMAQRWNRVVLLAQPRISSGDVDKLPSTIRENVSDFILTIMASVEQNTDESTGETRYRLADLGVGYAIDAGGGELRIVTVADAAKVGLPLGFLQRMMLAENEKQLDTAHVVVRTSTLMVVDTRAFVLRQGEHREFVMRHFIWIDPSTGRNAALVWLLEKDAAGNYRVDTSEPMRWAPAGLREDRAIHVDGEQFSMFGIPSERAFAIEDLPPGKPIPWTQEALDVAGLRQFDSGSLRQLSHALNSALRSSIAAK